MRFAEPIEILNDDSYLAEVFLPHFGSKKGMVVVSDFDTIREVRDSLESIGVGYSVVLQDERIDFDINQCVEMLNDWGWFGPDELKPEWVVDEEEPDPQEVPGE